MTDLKFTFDAARAVQAAAVVIRAAGGVENYTKLLKILYLADRQSLLETGHPITGDAFVAMKNGPVLSEVYNCIKAAPPRPFWQKYIERDVTDPFSVRLIRDPGDSRLSDYDVRVLDALVTKHQQDDYSRMIDIVHELREWRDPAPARVAPLPAAEIFRVEGESPEVVEHLAKQSAYFSAVGNLRTAS